MKRPLDIERPRRVTGSGPCCYPRAGAPPLGESRSVMMARRLRTMRYLYDARGRDVKEGGLTGRRADGPHQLPKCFTSSALVLCRRRSTRRSFIALIGVMPAIRRSRRPRSAGSCWVPRTARGSRPGTRSSPTSPRERAVPGVVEDGVVVAGTRQKAVPGARDAGVRGKVELKTPTCDGAGAGIGDGVGADEAGVPLRGLGEGRGDAAGGNRRSGPRQQRQCE